MKLPGKTQTPVRILFSLLAAGLTGCEEVEGLQFNIFSQPSPEVSGTSAGTPQEAPSPSGKESPISGVQSPGIAPNAFPDSATPAPQTDPTPFPSETSTPSAAETPSPSPSPSESPSPSPSASPTVEAEFIDPDWVDITQTYASGTTTITGAIANDGLDDTAAIQAHIDFADSSQRHVVYFPPGAYHLAGTLTPPTGITLRGTSRMSPVDASANSSLIYSGSSPQGVMIDLTARGATKYQTIEYLHFMGAPGLLYAIRMDMGHSRRIRSNLFEGIPVGAAAIGGGNVMFSYIEGNTFRNSDGYPIQLSQNLSRLPAAGYYGNNVGTIAANHFLGKRGVFVNGIFSILGNKFEIDGEGACAITLGDPAVSGGTDFIPKNAVQSQISINENLIQMKGPSACGIATSPYISASIRSNKFEGSGTQYGVNASGTSKVLLEANSFSQFAVGVVYTTGSAYPVSLDSKFFRVERPYTVLKTAPTFPPSTLSPDQDISAHLIAVKGATTSANFTEVSCRDTARGLDLRLGQFGFSPRTVTAGTTASANDGNMFELESGARLPLTGYQPGAPVFARTTDAASYQMQFADRQGTLPASFEAGVNIDPGSLPTVAPDAGANEPVTADLKTAFRLMAVNGCTTAACEVQLDLRNGTVFEIGSGTGPATVKLRPAVTTDPRATLTQYQGTLFVVGNARTSGSSLTFSPEFFSHLNVTTLAPGEFILLLVDSSGVIRQVTAGGAR